MQSKHARTERIPEVSSKPAMTHSPLESAAPAFGNSPYQDAETLTEYTSRADKLLARLPRKFLRAPDQHLVANELLRGCRNTRLRFMRLHGEWLYSALTRDCTVYRPLDELAFAAADAIPGLVPNRAEMDQERGLLQADKEGREVDQGIFFWGVLRARRSGSHLVDSGLRPTTQARARLTELDRESKVIVGAVHVERSGCIAYVIVQNDRSLNAEDDALIRDMEVAVDIVLLDERVRVAVLRGGAMKHPRHAGQRVFSSGIDLQDLHGGKISFVNFLLRRELGYVNKIRRGLLLEEQSAFTKERREQKAWLAAVDSFAVGGGVQLLLACDRVIAASNAYLSLPAASEGMIPGVDNVRLSQWVSGQMARQIILSGRTIGVAEPDARFLVDDVADPANMDSAIEAAAFQLSSGALHANRRLSALLEEPIDSFRAYMAEFALEQAQRLYNADVLSRIAATVAVGNQDD